MVWRDDEGALVAFNIAHQSGTEGWMGPLAVRTDPSTSEIQVLSGQWMRLTPNFRNLPLTRAS